MPTIRERDGKFQAIVRIKRNGVLVHQESRMFPTERLARSWGDGVECQIARGGVPARQRLSTTLSDLILMYRKAREGVKPLGRTTSADLDMMERKLGTRTLEQLTADVFSTFAMERRQEAGPATVLHNLSSIRTVMEAARPMFGIEIDGTAVNHAIAALATTGHVAKSSERDRRTTDDEIAKLVTDFERVATHPSNIIPMHTIVPLAVKLPRRLGELCDMRWDDYRGNTLTLRDTKHPRKPRTENIPVPPNAQVILDSLPRIDARILPYKAESVSAAFQRATERLKIADLHFHDLRHEGICRLFESGLDIPEVAMVSGHTSWTTLRRYTHLRPETVREKMNARQQTAP